MPETHAPHPKGRPPVARARTASIALLLLLAATSLAAAIGGARSGLAIGLLLIVLVGPLALALPGLLRSNRRTFAWATLCVSPHFVYSLTEIVANPALRWIAAAMLVLSLALVVALVAYLRLTRADSA